MRVAKFLKNNHAFNLDLVKIRRLGVEGEGGA